MSESRIAGHRDSDAIHHRAARFQDLGLRVDRRARAIGDSAEADGMCIEQPRVATERQQFGRGANPTLGVGKMARSESAKQRAARHERKVSRVAHPPGIESDREVSGRARMTAVR